MRQLVLLRTDRWEHKTLLRAPPPSLSSCDIRESTPASLRRPSNLWEGKSWAATWKHHRRLPLRLRIRSGRVAAALDMCWWEFGAGASIGIMGISHRIPAPPWGRAVSWAALCPPPLSVSNFLRASLGLLRHIGQLEFEFYAWLHGTQGRRPWPAPCKSRGAAVPWGGRPGNHVSRWSVMGG
jgi:hypothetical protein